MPRSLVIFDMDGTLTHDALDFESLRKELGLQERIPILEWLETLPAERRSRAGTILERHERFAAEQSTLRPGALETLDALRSRGVRCALLTRNSGRSMRRIMQRLQLTFDCSVSRDHGPYKPHPESIRMVLRQLSVHPGEALMVGDYLFDIQAAQAADVDSVLLTEPGLPLPAFARQAGFVVSELNQIVELIDAPDRFRLNRQPADSAERNLKC